MDFALFCSLPRLFWRRKKNITERKQPERAGVAGLGAREGSGEAEHRGQAEPPDQDFSKVRKKGGLTWGTQNGRGLHGLGLLDFYSPGGEGRANAGEKNARPGVFNAAAWAVVFVGDPKKTSSPTYSGAMLLPLQFTV